MSKHRKPTAKPTNPQAPRSAGSAAPKSRKVDRRTGSMWFATHGRDLRFVFVFATVLGVYYFATTTKVATEQFFPWYLKTNASVSASILRAIGYDNVVSNNQSITSKGGFAITVARGCDAVAPTALFIAAVLASPVLFRRKVPALLVGTVLLLVLNLVRIVSLYLTGLHFRSFFATMHLDVWQAVFILMALLFWAVWASRMARIKMRRGGSAPVGEST